MPCQCETKCLYRQSIKLNHPIKRRKKKKSADTKKKKTHNKNKDRKLGIRNVNRETHLEMLVSFGRNVFSQDLQIQADTHTRTHTQRGERCM